MTDRKILLESLSAFGPTLGTTLVGMRIDVLGPVRLSAHEGLSVKVPERHLRLLLASLVAAEGDPVSADALIDRLWGEEQPSNPKKVLRAKLSRLRTVLDQAHPGARGRLTYTSAGYRLEVSPHEVDARRFKDAVDRAREMVSAREKGETLQTALGLWRGEPYGDAVDETWLMSTIAELQDLRGNALESLVETLLDQGEPERALSLLNSAVEEHPTRERLIGAMMVTLYQLGRQHEALEMFESLRRRLSEDLGVDPSPRLRELHSRILRQDPFLLPARTSEKSPENIIPSNVPAEVEPLIGRHRESRQVEALLDNSRLVTLTGIGGVGKTRLATHLARGRARQRDGEVWFLDLTEMVTTPQEHFGTGERIAALAVSALGLSEHVPDTNNLQRLCNALRSRTALLVLDNCEHVISEATAFVTELLHRAPEVKVLVTSREPLGLPAEHRFVVGTLETEPTEDGEIGEAVAFFIARARAADPEFVLDERTIPTITELCRRLDGLPLALELAAGRSRGISVHDLLERLSDRLHLLRRPGRGAPRRQQTLRGMIDWSWTLLDEAERTVLRRLAVHPGTLDLAAAEAICADDLDEENPGAVAPHDVVDVLIGLVERSMVTTCSTPTSVRYGLLESIATYASEKLDEAEERDRVALRHLDHYLALAHKADRHLRCSRQRQWLPRLEDERTQLRNAFGTAVDKDDGRRAVALVTATFWYQWISGHKTHLLHDLRAAIDLPGPRDDAHATATTLVASIDAGTSTAHMPDRVADALTLFDDTVARAAVQWFAGSSLLAGGFREAGERHLGEAIAVLDAAGREWDVAVAAVHRDWFLMSHWGEAPRGLPDGRAPEDVLRPLGDGYGLSQVFAVEYRTAEMRGHHLRANTAAERALGVSLDLGLWSEAAYWHVALALTMLRSGDVTGAEDHLCRARTLAVEVAFWDTAHFSALAESMIARYKDDLVRARKSLDIWIDHEATDVLEPTAGFEEGFLAVQEGRLDHAEDVLRGLSTSVRRLTGPPWTARTLELAAAINASRGAARTAAELLGTADALRTRTDARPSAPESRDIGRVRALMEDQLGEKDVSEAFARGGGLDPKSQVEALGPTPTP